MITDIEGGKEAAVMSNWLETRGDSKIYQLWSLQYRPKPAGRGYRANMIEGRADAWRPSTLASATRIQVLGGNVGLSPYHMGHHARHPRRPT